MREEVKIYIDRFKRDGGLPRRVEERQKIAEEINKAYPDNLVDATCCSAKFVRQLKNLITKLDSQVDESINTQPKKRRGKPRKKRTDK